jgi:hypothetical protein
MQDIMRVVGKGGERVEESSAMREAKSGRYVVSNGIGQTSVQPSVLCSPSSLTERGTTGGRVIGGVL